MHIDILIWLRKQRIIDNTHSTWHDILINPTVMCCQSFINFDLLFPNSQEWQRKEQLYGQIIALFDKSKLWEYAVPLCKELCDLYENRIYDYHKLSSILSLQAAAYQNILATFRPHPEYFKVSFLGAAYPTFVRNKDFIYRGLDFEKIADFTARLAVEFPHAKLVTKVQC